MKKLMVRFAKDESGATAIEYGLIAALVSVVIIAGLNILGPELRLCSSVSVICSKRKPFSISFWLEINHWMKTKAEGLVTPRSRCI
jgi:pilus assembly protein Flp/PilA